MPLRVGASIPLLVKRPRLTGAFCIRNGGCLSVDWAQWSVRPKSRYHCGSAAGACQRAPIELFVLLLGAGGRDHTLQHVRDPDLPDGEQHPGFGTDGFLGGSTHRVLDTCGYPCVCDNQRGIELRPALNPRALLCPWKRVKSSHQNLSMPLNFLAAMPTMSQAISTAPVFKDPQWPHMEHRP